MDKGIATPEQKKEYQELKAKNMGQNPKKEQGVAENIEGHQDELEKNLRYARSRSPIADEIRKKLNPNQKPEKEQDKKQGVAEAKEFGEGDIQRWAQKSPENKKIYDAYVRINQQAKKAWEEKDGALYTGLQVRRKQLRDLIGKSMFGEQGVAEEIGRAHV